MPDFGIGEGLAALFSSGLFGAAEGAGAVGAGAGLGAEAAGVGALEGTGAALGGAEAAGAGGLGALGAGGADAFAAGSLGDLAAAGGGDAFGGGFGATGAATGDLGAAIPNALAAPSGGGIGASGFAPAAGVDLGAGIAPDATSAAAFNPGIDTFGARADAVSGAIGNGTFDPQGANATTFSGAGSPGGTPPAVTGADALSGQPAAGVPGTTAAPGASPGGTAGLDQSIINAQTGAGPATSLQPPGATVPGGAPAAPAAAPADGGGFLSKVGDSVMKNPLGLALSAGGLGYSVLAGQKQSAATKALEAQAAGQNATANQLSSYLTSGTLPPGLQASVDQATQSAKATAIANAAQQGLPTDPTQNSALAARLSQIDQQGPIVAAQIAQQLLQSGATYAGLSDQLYTQLAQIDQTQTQQVGKAIANMASALNTGGTKIQIGGTAA